MKVCITGASGFIGSNLLKVLNLNKVNTVSFSGDLLKKSDIAEFFSENKDIDTIIHLVGVFAGDLETLISVNVLTTANLLEAAAANGVKKFVYTSTGAVYGEPKEQESLEDDPLEPNTLYGLIKKQAEELIKLYCESNKMQYIILRFPNVYGEGNIRGVIFNFLDDIDKKHKVTIFGDGTQTRNFLNVYDACESMLKSLSYKKSAIFNISNPVKTSINDIIELLHRKGYIFDVEYKPQNNSLKDLLLNTEKAEKELGFKAKIKDLKV